MFLVKLKHSVFIYDTSRDKLIQVFHRELNDQTFDVEMFMTASLKPNMIKWFDMSRV